MSTAMSTPVGILHVTVISCSQLNNTNLLSRMDPYVVLETKKQKFKTTVRHNANDSPQFNESFTFQLDSTCDYLEIRVKSTGTILNTLIGKCDILTTELCSQNGEKRYPIMENNGLAVAGRVHLLTSFTPSNNHSQPASSMQLYPNVYPQKDIRSFDSSSPNQLPLPQPGFPLSPPPPYNPNSAPPAYNPNSIPSPISVPYTPPPSYGVPIQAAVPMASPAAMAPPVSMQSPNPNSSSFSQSHYAQLPVALPAPLPQAVPYVLPPVGTRVKTSRHVHQLTLVPHVYNGEYRCNQCDREGRGLCYNCSICNFDLHPSCLTHPTQLLQQYDFRHPHPLTLQPWVYKDGRFICDSCRKQGEGEVWHCNQCKVDFHPQCIRSA